MWAVPFGIVGARIYHVITTPEPYFGAGGHPIDALKIWHGGLGIWGAVVARRCVGAWIACRRTRDPAAADGRRARARASSLAQAIGRWGNWFNQELYGRPTDLPWALRIDPAHRPRAYADVATYHPTFLYESLWCLGVAALCIWADRRFRLGHGRVFALYVAAYTVGRAWIETLRVDTANDFFGLRLNLWVCLHRLRRVGGLSGDLVPPPPGPGDPRGDRCARPAAQPPRAPGRGHLRGVTGYPTSRRSAR